MQSTNENKEKYSTINILNRVTKQLDKQKKTKLSFVFILSVLSSIAESASLALIIPFVGFFIGSEEYLFNKFFLVILEYFNLENNKEILNAITLIFIFMILISAVIRISYIKYSNNLISTITSDFRIKIFNFLISQDYSYYFKYGAQEIMSNIAQKANSFNSVLFASINIFNSLLISLSIIIVIVFNEPFFSFVIFLILIFFFTIFRIRSSYVLSKGINISSNQNKMIDIFENTVGYLPEIIIYNLENYFLSYFSKVSREKALSTSEIRTISQTPKIYFELLILLFVIFLIFFLNLDKNILSQNLAYFAIIAVGAQKVFPLINSIYNLAINFKGSAPIVSNFLDILEKKENKKINTFMLNADKLDFKKKISINNLSFKYDNNSNKVLNNLSFEILKGSKVAIKGQTGRGKSTLINIISGLLTPTEGKIYVDNTEINYTNIKSWQKNIAIVPQNTFLSDSSIIENIAIGEDTNSININKVIATSKTAHIYEYINTLPNKFYEKVGEKGIRLSGGQKQRIGIARALYRDSNVIFLDEPTNALDSETEKTIMNSILKLEKNITIIMISHSNSLLEYFDQIIDLDKN